MPYTNKQTNIGWKGVAQKLRSMIETGELRPGAKLPSEVELIGQFGVSKMTIHRALRELAAEGVIRRVERVGSFVTDPSVPKTRTVGLFLPASDGFLEVKYLSGVQEVLGASCQIVLFGTENDPVLEAECLRQAAGQVDGILILPTCHPRVTQRLEQIHAGGCPVVCIDRLPVGSSLPGVCSDNYRATKTGLTQLMESGHRRIAYFGLFAMEMSSLHDRYRAYRDFVSEFGLGDPEELARFIEPRPYSEAYVGLRLFEDAVYRLLDEAESVTAAVCANEFYLNDLLEVTQGLPDRLKERFEIVSFYDWPHLTQPAIRTHAIRQDAREIGKRAAALLLAALDGEPESPDRIEVPSTFVPAVRSRRAIEDRRER